jgi:hypothetical protein
MKTRIAHHFKGIHRDYISLKALKRRWEHFREVVAKELLKEFDVSGVDEWGKGWWTGYIAGIHATLDEDDKCIGSLFEGEKEADNGDSTL